MADTEKELETILQQMLQTNPTFSKEMIEKAREELLKAKKDAEEFYKNKKGGD